MDNNIELQNLCLGLVRADTEKDVMDLLKKAGYWDNPTVWRHYGENENNFATIGNQQSAPDAAFVEKIINSVDAVLMRECLREGINPEGTDAPETLKDALEYFFDVKNGILTNVLPKKRAELAQNIMVVASGEKSNPCYSIIDKGEGQTPKKMPDTFLSLTKSNKLRIPFVQGKFNMGGTGALRFCGKQNLQLIISRKDPEVVNKEDGDETSDYWGFTVVRREDPVMGMRSSTYKYLAPNNEILRFKADSLPLLPGDYPIAYEQKLECGSLIKMYEYQLTGLKAPVYFDLNYRLSILLPNIALPVILYERRPGYKGHTPQTVLSGLSVRLEEDKYENIELGFPSSSSIKIKSQEMKIQIFVFKKDASVEHYKKDEGIIFTVSGQAHGFISKSFFTRRSVGMSYLADSILILADCSDFDGRIREDLFMNSRDRLCDGDLKKEIEDKMEDLIKNHPGLRELQVKRRREQIEGKIGDSKPLAEILEKVIKNSPTLSKLFVEGTRITNPFNLTVSGTNGEFKGNKFPTYFQLKKEFPKDCSKHCPINQRLRIQFETDAENNYFSRDTHRGDFKLFLSDGTLISDRTLNLWNGIANLTVELPPSAQIEKIIEFLVEVNDITRANPFSMNFYVFVNPPIVKRHGKEGERIKPAGNEEKEEERQKPSTLDLPNIKEVRQNDWEKYGFDKESALLIKDSGEGSYDFYINMDNIYLLTEIKGRVKAEPKILETQYQYGMVLIGLSLIRAFEEENKSNNEEPLDKIGKISTAIAPMLLPMITTLSELEIE